MSVLDGDDVVYIARVPTRRRILAVAIAVGPRFPADAASMGPVLLAGLSESDLDAALDDVQFTPFADTTVASVDELRRVHDATRDLGFAIVDQELEHGLRSAAAPVRSDAGAVIAAVNVSVHASRATGEEIEARFVPPLLEAVERIGADHAALGSAGRRTAHADATRRLVARTSRPAPRQGSVCSHRSEGIVPNIYVLPDQRLVECRMRETVLGAGLRAGVPFAHACGGRASCSTCRVVVVEGRGGCTDRTAKERAIADRLGFPPEFRLACQTKVAADLTVRRLVLDDDDIELADIRTGFVRRNVRGVAAWVFGGVARHRTRPQAIGEEQQVAVLFADIRGFTGFAEALLPYDVIHVLERHLRLVTRTVERHGGVVTSFMGDGLMALFRPGSRGSPGERALRTGLDLVAESDARRPVLGELYGRSFQLDVGVHVGPAIVGSMGGGPSSVTAIGDTVNLASRIEQANKEFGTRLLVSEAALADATGPVDVGRRFCCELPGKAGEYTLLEVLAATGERAG